MSASNSLRRHTVCALLCAALTGFAWPAVAHEEHGHGMDESQHATPFGRPGDPHKVDRTIRIELSDAMRFSPASIVVRQGETIRLVAANMGKTKHEMVLGTAAELKAHAELMRKYPGMEHADDSMVDVPAGKTAEIVWKFDTPGQFQYGCLIPGHFEAGMVGGIVVKPR